MSRVRIFVVVHKPSLIPRSGVLVPIHVGRAASRYRDEMGEYIGDDTVARYEQMLQTSLAWKVNEERNEKFNNPAILLGLSNDGIII